MPAITHACSIEFIGIAPTGSAGPAQHALQGLHHREGFLAVAALKVGQLIERQKVVCRFALAGLARLAPGVGHGHHVAGAVDVAALVQTVADKFGKGLEIGAGPSRVSAI